MSESKHTPGPWKLGAENMVWREPYLDDKGRRTHQPICNADTPAKLSPDERKANAHLIAESPEFYRVGKLILDRWVSGDLAGAVQELAAIINRLEE